jgi:hypothetical protein
MWLPAQSYLKNQRVCPAFIQSLGGLFQMGHASRRPGSVPNPAAGSSPGPTDEYSASGNPPHRLEHPPCRPHQGRKGQKTS